MQILHHGIVIVCVGPVIIKPGNFMNPERKLTFAETRFAKKGFA